MKTPEAYTKLNFMEHGRRFSRSCPVTHRTYMYIVPYLYRLWGRERVVSLNREGRSRANWVTLVENCMGKISINLIIVENRQLERAELP